MGTASVSEPPTLRICKILYNFSDNPVTNENPKTHTMIGMYKKLHRLIKRKRRISYFHKGFAFFFATDHETLC
ncbi:hypothetical protein E0D84_29210 [Bacillus wiedmannii]|nr:hypothetical protein E0D84_29210 [Bacillus wiedmannii]